MSKARTTLSVDADVLRQTRVAAARAGKRDSEIVEEALRAYLGLDVIDRLRSRSGLTAEQAETLAYRELHASRRRS
jgi:hypothetical protein